MRKKIFAFLLVLALFILGNLIACVSTATKNVVKIQNEKMEVVEKWETL